jgi:hypothetical protein
MKRRQAVRSPYNLGEALSSKSEIRVIRVIRG